MTIDIIPFDDRHFKSVVKLFDNNDFYFKTKRPESMSEGLIKRLLSNKGASAYLISVDGNAEGLLSIEEDRLDKAAAYVHLRLRDMALSAENVKELSKLIYDNMDSKYNIARMKLYDFDSMGKALCELLGFQKEAVLRKSVFKFDDYYDTLIYSKQLKGQVVDFDRE